jgi:hypothetical protein
MSSSVICRPAFGNPKNRKRPDYDLAWRRDGVGWILFHKRRRLGRVLPDNQHRGMYRSVLSRGRLSDMASLSWAKNAVLVAAERELEFEHRSRPANDPPKWPEKQGVFNGSAPPARFSADGGSDDRRAKQVAASIGCGAPSTSEPRS